MKNNNNNEKQCKLYVLWIWYVIGRKREKKGRGLNEGYSVTQNGDNNHNNHDNIDKNDCNTIKKTIITIVIVMIAKIIST